MGFFGKSEAEALLEINQQELAEQRTHLELLKFIHEEAAAASVLLPGYDKADKGACVYRRAVIQMKGITGGSIVETLFGDVYTSLTLAELQTLLMSPTTDATESTG